VIKSRATTCQSDALSGGFIEHGGGITDTYGGLRECNNDTRDGCIPSLTFDARSKTPTTGFVTALLENGSSVIAIAGAPQCDHEPY